MTHPKWKYHATERARIVATVEEEAMLGEGWVDSPVLLTQASSPAAAPTPALPPALTEPARKARAKARKEG